MVPLPIFTDQEEGLYQILSNLPQILQLIGGTYFKAYVPNHYTMDLIKRCVCENGKCG